MGRCDSRCMLSLCDRACTRYARIALGLPESVTALPEPLIHRGPGSAIDSFFHCEIAGGCVTLFPFLQGAYEIELGVTGGPRGGGGGGSPGPPVA